VIARHYNNKGVSLQQAGRLKSAIGDFQWALRLSPGYAEAHYNLADAYEELPAYDKAMGEYQKAIEADPTLYEAYNNLARLYIKRLRDPAAALGLLERAINLNPQERSVQYSLYKNYGWANFELHLWGQAEASLRRAIPLDPSRGEAHCLLAKVLEVQGNPARAFEEWETCAAYSSQTEGEPEWRAEAEERLNNNKEAEK
jgi:tetratricopeptide (TPR) repeat protein